MTEKISAAEYQRRLKAGTLETASKYGNKKIKWGGHTFDSKWEWERWLELVALEGCGEIVNLKRQIEFVIQPAFNRNAERIKGISYIADFVYEERINGELFTIIEDAKGFRTDVFKLKWKMLKYMLRDQANMKLIVTERGKRYANTRKSRS